MRAVRQLLDLDLGAELTEQPLGVVARWLRLDHRGPSGRVQAGQQDGGLYLGRGDRLRIADRQQLGGAGDRERQPVAAARDEPGAHLRERRHHPRHGPRA